MQQRNRPCRTSRASPEIRHDSGARALVLGARARRDGGAIATISKIAATIEAQVFRVADSAADKGSRINNSGSMGVGLNPRERWVSATQRPRLLIHEPTPSLGDSLRAVSSAGTWSGGGSQILPANQPNSAPALSPRRGSLGRRRRFGSWWRSSRRSWMPSRMAFLTSSRRVPAAAASSYCPPKRTVSMGSPNEK